MSPFEPNRYGPAVANLLKEKRLMPLGPGEPNRAVEGQLKALTAEGLFGQGRVRDRAMAAGCLAGLWLYHDFLDQSEAVSKGIATPAGTYWQALKARRQPDFAKAADLFRKVGAHPIFPALNAVATDLASALYLPPEANFLVGSEEWDPFSFIELCRVSLPKRGSIEERLCRQIQQQEWELLFDHGYRQAVAE